jgi:carbamoylphosphate synthase small subunit
MGTRRTEYALVMTDASTPRQFIKFVPPEVGKQGDADFATSSGYKDAEGNSLPVEDYLLIEQEA